MEEVRADRERVGWAIEETLRWEAPVQLAIREPTKLVELSGVRVEAGEQVLLALGSANRDDDQYPDAARFDLHRRPEDHFGFGFGRHFCAGAHLARLEVRTAINAILDRLSDVRFLPDAETRIVGLAFRSPTKLPVTFKKA
jgi:cytochrome P450